MTVKGHLHGKIFNLRAKSPDEIGKKGVKILNHAFGIFQNAHYSAELIKFGVGDKNSE